MQRALMIGLSLLTLAGCGTTGAVTATGAAGPIGASAKKAGPSQGLFDSFTFKVDAASQQGGNQLHPADGVLTLVITAKKPLAKAYTSGFVYAAGAGYSAVYFGQDGRLYMWYREYDHTSGKKTYKDAYYAVGTYTGSPTVGQTVEVAFAGDGKLSYHAKGLNPMGEDAIILKTSKKPTAEAKAPALLTR